MKSALKVFSCLSLVSYAQGASFSPKMMLSFLVTPICSYQKIALRTSMQTDYRASFCVNTFGGDVFQGSLSEEGQDTVPNGEALPLLTSAGYGNIISASDIVSYLNDPSQHVRRWANYDGANFVEEIVANDDPSLRAAMWRDQAPNLAFAPKGAFDAKSQNIQNFTTMSSGLRFGASCDFSLNQKLTFSLGFGWTLGLKETQESCYADFEILPDKRVTSLKTAAYTSMSKSGMAALPFPKNLLAEKVLVALHAKESWRITFGSRFSLNSRCALSPYIGIKNVAVSVTYLQGDLMIPHPHSSYTSAFLGQSDFKKALPERPFYSDMKAFFCGLSLSCFITPSQMISLGFEYSYGSADKRAFNVEEKGQPVLVAPSARPSRITHFRAPQGWHMSSPESISSSFKPYVSLQEFSIAVSYTRSV